MRKRKKSWFNKIDPIWTIGLTFVMALCLCVLAYNSYRVVTQKQEQIVTLVQKRKSKQRTLNTIKPRKNIISAGKFDLQSHYQELSASYTALLKYAYGAARSTKKLNKYRDLYIHYFGKKGYELIKQDAFIDNRPTALKNIATKVAFTHFNIKTMTTTVLAYTVYTAKPIANKDTICKEILYLTVDYNFKDKKISNLQIRGSEFDG